MDCQEMVEAKKYLMKFDQILADMAKEMMSQSITEDITIYFIECMIPHHQAAINMSENLLKYTKDACMQKIAQEIIQMQTKGIKQMEEVLKTTQGYISSKKEVSCYLYSYITITKNMIHRMQNSPRCINIDLNFIHEMIPHHEGAIAMCHNVLSYCIDPRLRRIAQSIIEEQSKGVIQLRKMQNNICNER